MHDMAALKIWLGVPELRHLIPSLKISLGHGRAVRDIDKIPGCLILKFANSTMISNAFFDTAR